MLPRPQSTVRLVRPALATALVVAVAGGPHAWPDRRLSSDAEAVVASITAEDLRASVTVLAGDAMQGRGVGHAGNDRAVAYLASRFEDLGLEPGAGGAEPPSLRDGEAQSAAPSPGPDRGYRQPVPLVTAELGPGNMLRLPAGAPSRAPREVGAGTEFYPVATSPSGRAEGPVAFTGFGPPPLPESSPCPWPELRGRILLGLDGEPPTRRSGATRLVNGPEDLPRRARVAAQCGALALLLASEDGRGPTFRSAWPARVSVANRPVFLEDSVLPLPVARVSLSLAAAVLGPDRRGRPWRATQLWDLGTRAARAEAELGGVVLAAGPANRPVRLHTAVENPAVPSWNVVGYLEGADRHAREQTVVVGAHLDHDGLDADGRIFNGADDNASGTAAVLEIAEAFARAAARGERPRRAVVFALWNAEEKGRFGSRVFVRTPLPAGRAPVVNVNLDMVGRNEEVPAGLDPRFRGLAPTPPGPNANAVDLLGYTRSPEAAAIVGQESGAVGLEVRERYDTHVQDLLRRSDLWSFIEAGIPAVGFTTGLHPDYHQPTDDADRIDYRKLERVSRLAFRVAWRLADAAVPLTMAPPATTEP
jgi:hypothetical protein